MHGKISISMKYLSALSGSLHQFPPLSSLFTIYCYSPRILPFPSCCSGSVNVLAIASQLCRYLSVSKNVDECMLVCFTRVCMNVLLFLSACLPYNSRNNNNNNSENMDGKFAAIGIFYAFTVFCCMLLGIAF